MKNFFEAIATLFEDYLLVPLNILRETKSWWCANALNFVFILIGFVAIIYWVRKLGEYNKHKEEDKSVTSHSFLK